MAQKTNESYAFADFLLDIPERLLKRNGQQIAVSDKAFETLCVLVKDAGHLVTKQDLMAKVWPDTFVEENNLDKSISILRQVLGERNGNQKFIETVRGHGYRFMPEVRRIEDGDMERPNEIESIAPEHVRDRRKSNLWIAITLLILTLLALGLKVFTTRNQVTAKPAQQTIQSIAVLPLKNLSGKAEQDSFADAMTDELITKLAQITSLRVISPTSVMEYRNTRKPIRQIAKELNVDGILEGSILQEGNRVRITAQLIHAETDTHVWADSYEREFQDILQLQNDVAGAIAREIHVKLAPEKTSQLTDAPKVKSDAYQAYLRGIYYSEREITEENLRLATEMFQKAVQLDPTFATAYAKLSIAESFLYFTFDRSSEDRLKKSKDALDKAFELDPGSAQAHLALGYFYYRGLGDFDRALEQFAIAERQIPNDSSVHAARGTIYRRQNKWDQAIEEEKKAIALNPRLAIANCDLATSYYVLRKYSEAQDYLNLCISLGPDEQFGYLGLALVHENSTGDLTAAREAIDRSPNKQEPDYLNERFWIEFRDRKYDTALQTISSPFADPLLGPILSGLAYRQLNRKQEAQESFESARKRIEQKLPSQSNDYYIHRLYGLALAGIGEKEKAIKEGKIALELLPVSKDAIWGPKNVLGLSVIYVLLGESDSALDQIEYLLSIPSDLSIPLLRIDPIWDPIRNHPRFRKLVNSNPKSA
jgi:TolB-like protein/DNA-binding winged helix-turn-helix (wHTH) protein/Flp pilus assembly protein TadD